MCRIEGQWIWTCDWVRWCCPRCLNATMAKITASTTMMQKCKILKIVEAPQTWKIVIEHQLPLWRERGRSTYTTVQKFCLKRYSDRRSIDHKMKFEGLPSSRTISSCVEDFYQHAQGNNVSCWLLLTLLVGQNVLQAEHQRKLKIKFSRYK